VINTRHDVPVTCVLESESGETVERLEDREGLVNTLIPPMSEQSFQCWRFIDEYGDTVFNRQQMPQFLAELAVIRDRTGDAAPRRVLDDIEALAFRCRDEVHLYLRFYGD
jgi:hypothetical protein